MVDATSVQKLNAAIEKINGQRLKSEARVEVLRKQLSEGLKKYQAQYGVNLQGEDFNGTKKLINAEVKSVVAKVGEEYNLKLKVVQAIESGDYVTAYQLLGIKMKAKEEEVESSGALSAEVLEDIKGLDEFGDDFEDPVEDESMGGLNFEEEEEDIGASNFMSAVSNVQKAQTAQSTKKSEVTGFKGSSVAEAMEDVDFGGFGSLEPEDDEAEDVLPEVDDGDFGFGNLLQGTKFGM